MRRSNNYVKTSFQTTRTTVWTSQGLISGRPFESAGWDALASEPARDQAPEPAWHPLHLRWRRSGYLLAAVRRLIYSMNVSLDGYVEPAGGGPDWAVPDEEL